MAQVDSIQQAAQLERLNSPEHSTDDPGSTDSCHADFMTKLQNQGGFRKHPVQKRSIATATSSSSISKSPADACQDSAHEMPAAPAEVVSAVGADLQPPVVPVGQHYEARSKDHQQSDLGNLQPPLSSQISAERPRLEADNRNGTNVETACKETQENPGQSISERLLALRNRPKAKSLCQPFAGLSSRPQQDLSSHEEPVPPRSAAESCQIQCSIPEQTADAQSMCLPDGSVGIDQRAASTGDDGSDSTQPHAQPSASRLHSVTADSNIDSAPTSDSDQGLKTPSKALEAQNSARIESSEQQESLPITAAADTESICPAAIQGPNAARGCEGSKQQASSLGTHRNVRDVVELEECNAGRAFPASANECPEHCTNQWKECMFSDTGRCTPAAASVRQYSALEAGTAEADWREHESDTLLGSVSRSKAKSDDIMGGHVPHPCSNSTPR